MFHPAGRPRSLLAQLAADCSFLEDIHVMDYSLLMGVHCKSFGETSASPLNTDKVRRVRGVQRLPGPAVALWHEWVSKKSRGYVWSVRRVAGAAPAAAIACRHRLRPHTSPPQEENEAYLSAEEGPHGSIDEEQMGAEADEEDEEGSGDEPGGAMQGAAAQRRRSIGAAARRRIGSAGVCFQPGGLVGRMLH